jgi:TP901 family phage tail tape measure protein
MPSVGNAAAQLQVVVSADTSAAEAGLSSLGGKLGSVGGTLATVFGGAAIAGVAALAAGFTGAVTAAAGFEKQMSAISAVSGATSSELQQLSTLALDLGKNTSFSASEAAVGIEELVKAGVSIGDIMGGAAAASLDLAAAGAVGVGDAAEIASNAMNVFGLKGSDMAHVADVIAGAANASAISVNDYKFSLAAAGAVAATVGIGFDDLSTAIAVMGNAGIKGSDAGTSLKTMLLNLQPGTKKQAELFRELGIVTADGANQFFTAEGKAKSLAEISGVLQSALAGMTEQQKLATLETLFGSDAIRAAAVLAKGGAEGFNEVAAAMGKVTAQAVAAERLNNLAGAWEQLKGSLETLAITLGIVFLPMLKAAVEGLTQFVNGLIPLAEAWGPAIVTGAQEAGAALAGFVQIATDAWNTVKQVFAGDWSPDESIQPFVNAVGQVATVLRDQVMPVVMEAAGFIIAQFQTVVDWAVANWPLIQQTVQTVVDAISAIWAAWGPAVLTVIQSAWTIITTIISTALTTILALITATMQAINGDWAGAWATMSAAVQTGLAAILTIMQASWTAIVAVVTTQLGILAGHFAPAWEAITAAVQTAMTAIQTAITNTWDAITTTIQGALDGLVGVMQGAWDGMLSTITAAVDAQRAAILAVWNLIPEDIRADLVLIANALIEHAAAWLATITDNGAAILAAVQTAWTTVQTTVQTILAAISADMTTQWAAIVATVQTQSAAAQAAVETAWNAVLAITSSIWSAVLAAVQGPLDQVVAAVQGMASSVLGTLQGLAGTAAGAAAAIGAAIVDGIRGAIMARAQSIASAAAAAVRNALNAAKAAIGAESPSRLFRDEVGLMMARGIELGIMDGVGGIEAALGAAVAAPRMTPYTVAGAVSAPQPSAPAERPGGATFNFYGVQPESMFSEADRRARKQELMYRIGG